MSFKIPLHRLPYAFRKPKVWLAATLSISLLHSCTDKKEEAVPVGVVSKADTRSAPITYVKADVHLETLARSLSIVLAKNPSAITVLDAALAEEFDGDHDVSYNTLCSLPVGKQTFGQLMASEYPTNQMLDPNTEVGARIIVSVPVESERLVQYSTPAVVSVPTGFTEGVDTSVTGYLSGNALSFDTRTEPTEPVVVVSIGERLDKDGLVRPEFTHSTITRPPVSSREVGDQEFLTGVRCDDLGAIEPWIRGRPELRLYVASTVAGTNPNTPPTQTGVKIQDKILFNPRRNQVGGRMWDLDGAYKLFTWTDQFSNYYNMTWVEEDGGPTVKLSLGVTGEFGGFNIDGKGKINLGNLDIDFSKWENDDDIGGQLIYRFDDGRPGTRAPILIRYGSIFTAQVQPQQ